MDEGEHPMLRPQSCAQQLERDDEVEGVLQRDQGEPCGVLRVPGRPQPQRRPQDVHGQGAGEAIQLKEKDHYNSSMI